MLIVRQQVTPRLGSSNIGCTWIRPNYERFWILGVYAPVLAILVRSPMLRPQKCDGYSDLTPACVMISQTLEQLLDLHAPMVAGSTVYFAQPDAFKGSLVKTLKEVRPTLFIGVPRVRDMEA